jgi:hypothetical protein
MTITVLAAVDQASREIGIAQFPVTQAIGSADQDISQMTALLSAVADELLLDEPYEESIGDGYWLYDATTGTRKNKPTNDNDVVMFDGRLTINGLKFRFLKAKGLEFGEELRDFTTVLNKLAAKANAQVVDLHNDAGPVQ